ncbi:pyridoxamine 5'-phosphate oxidase family protein [Gulosibacter molinativorax]|uniref:Pyridoxamine 5'-phosphate oxidase family protein n=1 Tax=Gulosibacter molinativorax TaxID=256821 RepID=A0ABT7C7N0_9MICO|nr:pyridoxamine 5'-phosphate oxidase family protein [Gulosibacter molinativorax]MDJ1371215.1 pyridoxamine 5'-phosphate oxidase family protein [Gulosibacter molinativorax]QUY63031.1 Pyridoxamine 5-phosphate oxidase [Gulosibacter molinativorax]
MTEDAVVEILDDTRARTLLGGHTLGRLVERIHDITEIFPVNYWSDGHRIVIRTAPGTKLAGAVVADEILFQVDNVTEDVAWSVVAHCTARVLESAEEIERASQLDLHPLVPTVKEVFVEFKIGEISGRYFHLGAEPEAEPETVS